MKLAVVDAGTGRRAASVVREDVRPGTHHDVLTSMIGGLNPALASSLVGAGHRVVHGGPDYVDAVVVDDGVVAGLEALVPLAPLHLPANIDGMVAVGRALPQLGQVAVFDTGFHRTLPPRAYRYAVPAEWYEDHGARRYGFHGISCRYVLGRTAELLGRPPSDMRIVVAHLGNGCSATAVRDAKSLDTSMGFTPLEGLVMGTRSGDVDPGLLAYLAPRLGLDLPQVVDVLNTRSGLAGLSGVGGDVRDVSAAAAAGSADAALALEVFAYRLAKTVAALAVPLERLDALVFTGGIGEHSAEVRSQVLAGLGLLGLAEDPEANAPHGTRTDGRISAVGATVALVVPTDEERVIAADTARLLAL